MNPQPIPEATIRSILAEFFDEELFGKRGVIRQRTLAVQTMLRRYLELEGERILPEAQLALLVAEREFDPHGAFARTMHADDLVVALAAFMEPPWLAVDPLLRQRQISVALALLKFIDREMLVVEDGMECFVLETHAAIDRARRGLKEQRRAQTEAESG